MTDCIHNGKRDLVDCTTELLAARKEVMRLNSLMAGKVLLDREQAFQALSLANNSAEISFYEPSKTKFRALANHFREAIDKSY